MKWSKICARATAALPASVWRKILDSTRRWWRDCGVQTGRSWSVWTTTGRRRRMRSGSCLSASSAEAMWFTQAMGTRSTAPFAILAHGWMTWWQGLCSGNQKICTWRAILRRSVLWWTVCSNMKTVIPTLSVWCCAPPEISPMCP